MEKIKRLIHVSEERKEKVSKMKEFLFKSLKQKNFNKLLAFEKILKSMRLRLNLLKGLGQSEKVGKPVTRPQNEMQLKLSW